VLELGGVRDVLTKSIGTQNPINLVKATMDGLVRLRRPEEVAELRGLTVAQVLGIQKTNGSGQSVPAAGPVAGEDSSSSQAAGEEPTPAPPTAQAAEIPAAPAAEAEAPAEQREPASEPKAEEAPAADPTPDSPTEPVEPEVASDATPVEEPAPPAEEGQS
jgi:hypothetical protein